MHGVEECMAPYARVKPHQGRRRLLGRRSRVPEAALRAVPAGYAAVQLQAVWHGSRALAPACPVRAVPPGFVGPVGRAVRGLRPPLQLCLLQLVDSSWGRPWPCLLPCSSKSFYLPVSIRSIS